MSLDDQLDALLGGASFEERERRLPPSTRLTNVDTRRKWSFGRASSTVVLSGVAVFAVWVVRVGLGARSDERAREVLAQLGDVASQGATQQAMLVANSLHEREHMAPEEAILLARTEAILYRFRDAAPERTAVIERLLARPEVAARDDQVRIVRAILAPRRERAAMIESLAALAEGATDPEPSYLLATAYAHRADEDRAKAAFERSLELEPAHLEHLGAYGAQQLEAGEVDAANALLDVMREVDPRSPRVHLLALRVDPEAAQGARLDDPEVPRVVRAEAALVAAIAAAHRGASDEASAALEEAVELVRGDRAFLIDLADELIRAGQTDLARSVVAHATWPTDDATAAAVTADLAARERFVVGKVRIKKKPKKKRARKKRRRRR